MQLRDYQIKIKQEIYNAWAQGAQNVGAQLATGAGKTVIFSNIISENTGYAIAIAHRMELVSQISLTLAQHNIRHNIIAQSATIRNIIALHMKKFGRSYYQPQAKNIVAGIDTLIRLDPNTPWFKKITLVVQDEGHHLLKNNKWGRAASLFPQARGLYPTATPIRADGCGLGRHADGLLDVLVVGPTMRELINRGYLTEYRLIAPQCTIDLSQVPLSDSGDYSPPKLRAAVHKSSITGDVISHYQKFANGKSGVTFAVDIESAIELTKAYRAAGIPAETISSKTPDLLRFQIIEKFKHREILQLVNVDLLGEGIDVPGIEVVSMVRPTHSYSLFVQQFGRPLRLMENKKYAIIIDHVGNWSRHGLPDKMRPWSLDRRERKARATPTDVIPIRTCLNPMCLGVYERTFRSCPHCGFYSPPAERSAPEYVDGDLLELDPEVLAILRGEIKRIDDVPHPPQHLDAIAQRAIVNRHLERQRLQSALRSDIALWAGYRKAEGLNDSEIYRRFYFSFNVDVATAQTLNSKETEKLKIRINDHLLIDNVVSSGLESNT